MKCFENACLLALAWTAVSEVAAEPGIRIVFPAAGTCVRTEGRTFVIGSISPADSPLTVNGQTVTPWRTGGFLYMADVAPGTNTLVFRAGDIEHRHTFTVPQPSPGWDGKSLRVQQPLLPRGVRTNESVVLECLAPAGITVYAAVGERTLTLTPQGDHATRHSGHATFATPAENVPVTFFAGSLPDAPGAPLTARTEWPAYTVTGGLFEVRARTAPGDGDTVAFLPPGFRARASGYVGAHTRLTLSGTSCYVESRHLAPAPDTARPPQDLPLPNLASGYGPNPPTNRTPDGLLIVLDPGHGGSASGAIGPTGIAEKHVTLEQAKLVQAVLEAAGFRVRLTRTNDTDPDLYERVRLAYSEKAAAFLSIHYNSCAPSGNPQTRRHIATYAWNGIGEQLARALHPHLAAACAIPDEGVQYASFAVCRNPAVPSALLELDFITAPEGEEAVRTPERQLRVAQAILAGLRDWLSPIETPADGAGQDSAKP